MLLSEGSDFLKELIQSFIQSMVILEANCQLYKYKKSKFIMYLEEINNNLFEIFSFIKQVKENVKYIDLIIIDEDNLLFKLDSLMNQIIFPDNLITKKGIGLLPIQKSCISTKGFRWDVGINYHLKSFNILGFFKAKRWF